MLTLLQNVHTALCTCSHPCAPRHPAPQSTASAAPPLSWHGWRRLAAASAG